VQKQLVNASAVKAKRKAVALADVTVEFDADKKLLLEHMREV
jgi:hypothetical protein